MLAACAAMLAGCAGDPEVRGRGPETVGAADAPTRSRWSNYLQVMTDKERQQFLAIEESFDREQWLRRKGIDVRVDLDRRLSKGISVAAAKSRIEEPLDEETVDGDTTMLFYSRYNTRGRTNFWLKFRDRQLVAWNSYTLEEQRRERDILEFESRLMDKFNTVLERGMGMNQIRRQADNARDNLNRVELAHREKTADPDYHGVHGASMSDYLVAESLLQARTTNELFSWFQGREPDDVIVHRPYETHQYFTTYTDIWDNETVVTVEFIFKNNLLEDWFVYHER